MSRSFRVFPDFAPFSLALRQTAGLVCLFVFPEPAAIVEGCSDTTAAVKEDWQLRKKRYLAHLESAPPAVLLVSAADKLHNARSILGDLRVHSEELWERFNRGPREQLWYYGSLRDAFIRVGPAAVRANCHGDAVRGRRDGAGVPVPLRCRRAPPDRQPSRLLT